METLTLVAPIDGWLVPLADVCDAAFAGGMIGEGVAIDPLHGVVIAPCDGVIVSVAKARHALTMRARNGAEILIHLGIDTVAANGVGLAVRVGAGQQVSQGDVLVDVDLDELLPHAKSLVTPVVVVNAEQFTVRVCGAPGPVERGVALFEISQATRQAVAGIGSSGDGEICEDLEVALPHGIHARPAARIVHIARANDVRLTLSLSGRTADARSMVALMALGAGHGDRVRAAGSGAGAREAIDALAAVLATTSADAGEGEEATAVTRTADGDGKSAEHPDDAEIRGLVASRGLAIGFAQSLQRSRFTVREEGEGAERERGNLRRGLREAAKALREMQRSGGSDILAAQVELLEDPTLLADADAVISEGKSAGHAWQRAIQRAREAFASSRDARIAERVADLSDVEGQVLLALTGSRHESQPELAADAILLADDLLPSQLGRLAANGLAGFCCAHGGPTSHVALMAAARGIPAIVGAGARVLGIATGTRLLLDADRGVLVVDPDEAAMSSARMKMQARGEARAAHLHDAAQPACTADGACIEVLANLASEDEAVAATQSGADGCGLLRTELLFLDRESAPTEDEQVAHYQAIARALGDRPLVIRTLDVGGDKPLAYMPLPGEENPLLGLRGLRASLRFPGILKSQLAAILRVEPSTQCRILLPMITEPGEIRTVRDILTDLLAEHDAGRSIALGAMIETPASVVLAGAIAREADFLSIGTNDLAQYTLAMDRAHPALARSFDYLHPAVLQQIAAVCAAGNEAGRNVSVCGALASELAAAAILIGLGVRTLSVVPGVVPELKALIRRLRLDDCRAMVARVLEMDHASAVRGTAEAFLRDMTAGPPQT